MYMIQNSRKNFIFDAIDRRIKLFSRLRFVLSFQLSEKMRAALPVVQEKYFLLRTAMSTN